MAKITFVDLFCGIGGFRLALNQAQCVFSAEINPHAIDMYETNYQDNPTCDITQLNPNTMPEFDILCAGFPCQAFSRAGKQKGFEDARGTLFFDLCRIIENKKPKVVFLENVKNLINHDKGNTLKVILGDLEKLGYLISYEVLNAKDFGVPQNRERIIIVGVRQDTYHVAFDFSKIKKQPSNTIESILEHVVDESYYLNPSEYTLIPNPVIQSKSGLKFVGYRNKNMRLNGINQNTEHLSRCHKQSNRIYSVEGTHPTLSSQESSGRYFVLLKNGRVRKLTMLECYRLMGFPDDFKKIGSQANLYARVGNSVCVRMMQSVGQAIIEQYFKG